MYLILLFKENIHTLLSWRAFFWNFTRLLYFFACRADYDLYSAMTPFAHQQKTAARLLFLLRNRFTAADMSETGVGKTVTALLVATQLGRPFLVVCPKNLLSHWRRWTTEMALGGLCLVVANWEAFKLGLLPQFYGRKEGWRLPSGSLVIFDEAHRAKSGKTLNAQILARSRRQGYCTLLLSATLILDVLSLSGLGYPLGLVAEPKYWSGYARRYGLGLNRWGGWDDFSSPGQRRALQTQLALTGARVRRAEIALQSALSQADLVDLPNAEALRRLYASLDERAAELAGQKENASSALVARLRARQEIELLKVPSYVEIALEHLEAGAKVALFLNFTDSVRAAEKLFHPIQVRTITGETGAFDREIALEAFNNADCDILVLNIAAGGEGLSLHDSDGRKPRVALLSPPESAVVLLQALGRICGRTGQKSVGLNRILFVAGTVEERVHRNVCAKIHHLEQLNDGDLTI